LTRNSAGLTLPPRPGSLLDENAGSTLSGNQQEIAFLQGFITAEAAAERGRALAKTAYGRAILTAIKEAPELLPFAERRMGDRRLSQS